MKTLSRFVVLALASLAACSGAPSNPAMSANGEPGKFVLHSRARRETAAGSGQWAVVDQTVTWDAKKTAVVICDMWDTHNCKSAARRVGEMVPRLNELLRAARAKGSLVIHSPSDTTDKFYAEHPRRKAAKEVPRAEPPMEIKNRGYDAKLEGPFPFKNELWHCDDEPVCPVQKPYPWSRQHAGIEIDGNDFITERGQEVYNIMEQRGITNVLMTGVHTNYCVVGRSFGIRQMVMLKRPIVLVRDLTDSLYNPKEPPQVSHERGTELVVEHIEKYWCPSVLSRDVIGR